MGSSVAYYGRPLTIFYKSIYAEISGFERDATNDKDGMTVRPPLVINQMLLLAGLSALSP